MNLKNDGSPQSRKEAGISKGVNSFFSFARKYESIYKWEFV
jgi:hypothetical protein